MRPIYENDLTKIEESNFADEICSTWSVHLQKLKMSMGLDFAIVKKSKIVGFAELKCRKVTKNQYPTYLIGLSKIIYAKNINQSCQKPVILFVKWADCAGWVRLDDPELKFDLAMGGRKDRNDWQDIEPICFIPVSEFTIM